MLPERHRDLKQDGSPKDTAKDRDYFSARWMTWQMSDHLPLWVELAIDFSDEHLLSNLIEGAVDTPAQREFAEEAEDLSVYHGEAPRLPEDEDKPVETAPKPTARKRRKPKIAAKEKVGTARPNPRLTLREAWKIFWFVASGKADRIRKLRREAERKAKSK